MILVGVVNSPCLVEVVKMVDVVVVLENFGASERRKAINARDRLRVHPISLCSEVAVDKIRE
jgi:hypothetical protein